MPFRLSLVLRACAALLLTGLLAACSLSEEGDLGVIWIASEEDLLDEGLRLSSGAQHVRGATQSGLVSFDAQGEVIPALAERWIITEDGLSFIFRLREETWPDGSEMTSESVRRALRQTIRALDGTSLSLDLAPIEEIRAMTGRVIEIRLMSPVPDLLVLLAQPELALRGPEGFTGPMTLTQPVDGGALMLGMRPPLERGMPEYEGWEEDFRNISVIATDAERAVELFDDGEVALVLGGRIDSLPLADTGPLSRGTVRIDPALGLFGLRVLAQEGILADPALREAIAMAIDRDALMARYNLGGWVPTTRVVAPGLINDPGEVGERWSDTSVEDLRSIAAERVRGWRIANREAGQDAEQPSEEGPASSVELTIDLGKAPGLDLLLSDLSSQFATIGIRLVRAEDPASADLKLVDRVARYPDPRWFLNQFHCSLGNGQCSDDADYLVEVALETIDAAERACLLAEAEAELTLANVYIPIGAPLRWSLVRGSVDGFAPNAFAFHPLPPLAQIPR